MPLINVWLRKGTTIEYRGAISKNIQRAMIDVLKIPDDDYFQITNEMDPENIIYDPNFFGVSRSEKMVIIQFSFNSRPAAVKQRLFETTAEYLHADPGLRKEDVVMMTLETAHENWWAYGRTVDPLTGTDSRMTR
jgi:4-oxalocrotonate tautomerase